MTYPKLAALAVVVHDGNVLLVRRKKEPDAGLWGFPGGHVELGETALAAAARELIEETSVVATPLRYLTNLDIIIREGGTPLHHFLLAAVLCRYESGEPQAGDDALEAGWFDAGQIAMLPKSANVDTVIGLAMS